MPVMGRTGAVGSVVAVLMVSGVMYHLHGRGWAATGMNMPDQDIPKTAAPANTSSTVPPGYAEIQIPGEIRQRIGVTLGRVEEAPLTMNIRAVGIVRPTTGIGILTVLTGRAAETVPPKEKRLDAISRTGRGAQAFRYPPPPRPQDPPVAFHGRSGSRQP